METGNSNFFLMRHGETDTNRNHIWQGSQDIPLNDAGREQARIASEIVREIDPDIVITSNLSRAIETGDIATQFSVKARYIVNPRIRERTCGELEGLTTSEILDRYGIRMDMTSREVDSIPGVEPYGDFKARVVSELKNIYREYEGKKILVVSHGGVIRNFYETEIGYLPSGMVFRNCSILSLKLSGEKWEILDKYNTTQI